MSVEDEITDILRNAQGVQETEVANTLALTVAEVEALLEATNDSLHHCCVKIESASTKQELLIAFRKFDRIMRFFLCGVKYKNHEQLILHTGCGISQGQQVL